MSRVGDRDTNGRSLVEKHLRRKESRTGEGKRGIDDKR
jgi:hypothetical protein